MTHFPTPICAAQWSTMPSRHIVGVIMFMSTTTVVEVLVHRNRGGGGEGEEEEERGKRGGGEEEELGNTFLLKYAAKFIFILTSIKNVTLDWQPFYLPPIYLFLILSSLVFPFILLKTPSLLPSVYWRLHLITQAAALIPYILCVVTIFLQTKWNMHLHTCDIPR